MGTMQRQKRIQRERLGLARRKLLRVKLGEVLVLIDMPAEPSTRLWQVAYDTLPPSGSAIAPPA